MSVYSSDDEEWERLKAWWKANGRAVTAGVVLGIGLVFAGNYWKHYKTAKAETASALYEQMLMQQQQGNKAAIQATGGKLMQEFASTPYAGEAALLLAKASFEAGDVASSRAQLQWAIDHATEEATRHAARLRLARIMLDKGEIEPALKLIDVKDQDGFESEYQELKGDLLVKKGDMDGARRAYRLAKESLPPNAPYGRVLNMKLDDLGPGK
ncbi:MAG TPA: tetratricopeptide repeat protein [Acidiferrobacterales bacterium]|nr:tetratricopeptide repeat protein [Acidiferrobacterales bacterium]